MKIRNYADLVRVRHVPLAALLHPTATLQNTLHSTGASQTHRTIQNHPDLPAFREDGPKRDCMYIVVGFFFGGGGGVNWRLEHVRIQNVFSKLKAVNIVDFSFFIRAQVYLCQV